MRIIAGIAKGMPLTVPRRGVRPTADRVREAIFSSLGERVVGADVLDLYAGSGALGLEAASRGARSVVFVEKARASLDALEKNLAGFAKNRGVTCAFEVLRGDVLAQIKRLDDRRLSLIFADPPYGESPVLLLCAAKQRRLLREGGVLVFESGKRDAFAVEPGWEVVREAVYGDTRVSFLTAE